MEECDINHNGKVTRKELELSKGFVFGTKLKASSIEGVARTTKDIKNLNRIFGGEHQINIHDDGFIIRDAKRKIASSLKIDENISSNALRILFDAQDKIYQLSLEGDEDYEYEKENKIIDDMTHREYSAFLINNKEILIDIFTNINVVKLLILKKQLQ